MSTRWEELDFTQTGKVTRGDTVRFLAEVKGGDLSKE